MITLLCNRNYIVFANISGTLRLAVSQCTNSYHRMAFIAHTMIDQVVQFSASACVAQIVHQQYI